MSKVRLLVLLGLDALGCHSTPDCSTLGVVAGVAAGARILRLEVYTSPALCQGDQVVTGGAALLRSLSFPPSAIPPIDLPPGLAVVHLQAFDDATETTLLGEGCSVTEIRAGEGACLSLQISKVQLGDGGCRLIVHSNGIGQTYQDCAPVGTVNDRLAQEACIAAGNGGSCTSHVCSGKDGGSAICQQGQSCTCWTYSGPQAGLVHVSSGGGCDCGATGDPAWN